MQASSTSARLARAIAGDLAPDPFVAELEGWLASGRVRAFVEANGPKVRRKLRSVTGDPEGLADVRAELLVACRLLGDRRVELGFETYARAGAGPDFTVTFRGVSTFTVEVTRRRGVLDGPGVVDAAVAKLRQLPPSVANLVVVAGDGQPGASSIAEAVRILRAHVDAGDPATHRRLRIERPRDFYERFLRLSGLVAWTEAAPAGERVAAWPNPSARHVLEPAAWKAVTNGLGEG